MKQYLTISEFAKLRNININSLRYYEKLQILIPAWVDSKTKYRYYLPEQLLILDAILLFIRLGIPLKDMKNYIDMSGTMDQHQVLEDGKKRMEKEIANMQLGFQFLQFNLNSMEQNQKYSDRKDIYTREIEDRYLIVQSYTGSWNDIMEKEQMVLSFFQSAQEQGMAPALPAGLLVHLDKWPISYSFFFLVLYPQKENRQVIHLPKANYSCFQVDLTPQTDIPALLREKFCTRNVKTAIISNMMFHKVHFNSRKSEVQILLTS